MPAPATRDYFAELYVAALFGDAGWSVYFPKRDVGFDFIATKPAGGEVLIRPVQVKGLYPTAEKTDKATYGFKGKLTALHNLMVLALPFFHNTNLHAPEHIAFMPRDQCNVLIRLSQTHTRCSGSCFTGVKFSVGGRSDVARDPKQEAKRVEGVKATIKSECELVEVRLQVLWADAVMDAT